MDISNMILARSAKRLKEVRKSSGFNQKQFAEKFEANPSTYNRYESGSTDTIPLRLIMAISSTYGINPAWLSGYDSAKYSLGENEQKLKPIPVFGLIAAGIPILAQEDFLGYEYVPENVSVDFCLRVKGDSMIGARILDGDLVYIRKQPDVENGEIAAVMIGGDEATLKRVYKINGSVIIRAENPAYQDKTFSKKDIRNISIIGKAIFFRSEVR